ncbi:MAG: M28 family peptidase [Alphaproteobacteria bacterium]|nr:M28 family peptidase [Alphaproteobacteria bacterium]
MASGEGAGDAMSGVAAALEVLATLQAEPLDAGVLVLFDEGEEADLYGAKAFVQRSAWRDRVEAVVNLEARGTSGASYLFEATGDLPALGSAYARQARRPSASGLYVAIYRLLPNSTDVSVFDAAGLPAVNLAFLGHGEQYHTPRDDRAHLDPRSLQHHVDQALGALRALDSLDPGEYATPTSALLFDVGGLFVVSLSIPVARGVLGLLALLVLALARPSRRALAGAVLVPVGAGLSALAVDLAVHAAGGSWAAFTPLAVLALQASALGWVVVGGRVTGDAEDARVGAVAWVYVGLTVVLLVFLPEGAHLGGMGLPLLALALAVPRLRAVAVAAGWTIAVLAAGLPDALGAYGPVVAGPAALAFLPLLAVGLPGWRAVGLLWSPLVAVAVLSVVLPDAPAALEVEHVTDGQHGWIWAADVRFPRGGPTPALASPVAEPPPMFRWKGIGDGPVDGFLAPRVLEEDGAIVVVAPGGTELRALVDRPVRTVEGAPADRRLVVWKGATDRVRLELDPATTSVDLAVARPAPESRFGFDLPWEPIHTGARTWSYVRWATGSTTPR